MQPEIFRGPDLQRLVRQLRRELGEDAHVVETKVLDREGVRVFEVQAMRAGEARAARARLGDGGAPPWTPAGRRKDRIGPAVVAVVGPPGAGKTTAVMKLALSPRGLDGLTVGLVTLDTFRIGAVEELHTYAEITGFPLEVVYSRSDVPGALERLRHCDVVVVDTPGRPPVGGDAEPWHTVLTALDPDEVHLAVPSGLRLDVALGLAGRYAACRPTHVLATRADEVPGPAPVARLCEELELPARWVGRGQDVPRGLEAAARSLTGSLGMDAAAGAGEVA